MACLALPQRLGLLLLDQQRCPQDSATADSNGEDNYQTLYDRRPRQAEEI